MSIKILDAHIFDQCVGCLVWVSHLFLFLRCSVRILQICWYGVNERAASTEELWWGFFIHSQCSSSYRQIQKPQAFMETFTLMVIETRTLEEDMVLNERNGWQKLHHYLSSHQSAFCFKVKTVQYSYTLFGHTVACWKFTVKFENVSKDGFIFSKLCNECIWFEEWLPIKKGGASHDTWRHSGN